MRKLGSLILAGAIVLIPSAALASSQVDTTLATASEHYGKYISEYTAQYYVNTDGTVDVTIDFTYQFNGEYGHGPYVSYPIRVSYDDTNDRFYNISNVQASSPTGAPADINVEKEKYWVAYKIGDPDIDDVTGTQEYHVTYTVDGLLNSTTMSDFDPDATDDTPLWDEFYVNAIGDQWEIPLDNVTIVVGGDADAISVTAPGESTPTDVLCFTGYYGSSETCDIARLEGGVAVFGQASIDPYESMTVDVAFPAGSFDTAPIVRNKNDFLYAFSLNWGTGLGFLGVLGLGVLLLSRALRGKAADKQYAGLTPGLSPAENDAFHIVKRDYQSPVAVRFDPPPGLRPGQLGTLLDESADVRDVTSTIVDLAVRGYLKVEEVAEKGKKKATKNTDYALVKLRDADDAMVSYEKTLFNALFTTGDRVTLSGLKTTFASHLAKVQAALYKNVTTLGWFRGNPQKARIAWLGVGFGILALGVGLTIALAFMGPWALIPLPIALVGLMTMVTMKAAPARKAEGTRVLAQTLGFQRFLETADGNKLRFEEGRDIFSLFLPFAIAFGVADKWTATFTKLAKQGVKLAEPTWYAGAYGPFWVNAGTFGQRLDGFTALAHAAMSTPTPGSSGGSGFGGGSFGGGGFSGGGSFGGGGGGW